MIKKFKSFVFLCALGSIVSCALLFATVTNSNLVAKPTNIKQPAVKSPTTKAEAQAEKESVISCNKCEYDFEENIVYLRGNVRVSFDGNTLESDQATVYLQKETKQDKTNQSKSKSGFQNFYKIVALGNVLIKSKERDVAAQKAVWNRQTNKIVFTGGPPIAKQGLTYIKATRIVIGLSDKTVNFYPEPQVLFNIEDKDRKNFGL